MNNGMIYAVTAIVCMLQILLIINRTGATEYKETIDNRFRGMLWFFVVFCFVDALWGLCESHTIIRSPQVFTFIAYGYHFCAGISACVWFNYAICYVKGVGIEKKILRGFSGIMVLVQTAALVYNAFSHEAFYVDAAGGYHMGAMRPVVYMLQFSYYVVLMLYALIKVLSDKKNRRGDGTVILFSLVPLLFCVAQYVFYDVAMYSLGFLVSSVVIYSFNVTVQREEYLEEKMNRQRRRHTSIIHALAGNFVAIYYIDPVTGRFATYTKSANGEELTKRDEGDKDYFVAAVENSRKFVVPEDFPIIKEKVTREGIAAELADKSTFSITVRVFYKGEPTYFRYKYVRPTTKGEEDKLIVGVYNVDDEVKAEIEKQEQIRLAKEREQFLEEKAFLLSNDVYSDALTGILNRRAYESDIEARGYYPKGKNFVYVSFDLNGLKTTNDNIGHEAGDELLRGAAECMKSCFGKYGKLYRVGGDEFVAMITADDERMESINSEFIFMMENWRGQRVSSLSISYGYASRSEFPEMSIAELAQVADKRMYQSKAMHYSSLGIDRRGQQAAFDALCKTYAKILKVNLTDDTFAVLQIDVEELDESRGYREKFTDWMKEFAKSGQVREQDVDIFLKKTDIDYMRGYFIEGNQVLGIYYYRKLKGEYKKVMLEIIPSKEYTNENQIVFMYVKSIEG